MAHSPVSPPIDNLYKLALKADRMVVGVVLLGALAAVALGVINGPAASGSAMALALSAAALIAWRLAPGTLFSRLSLAVIGMLMVALHIQLSMGLTELHFGVFVFLAFLLVYRDWRPIVAAAATIAVHHIVFDRLQAFGWPVFCMAAPNFALVLVHAAFVIVQTAVEIVIAVGMRADANASQELHTLCQPTPDGQLNLDVQSIEVRSPSAIAVRSAFLKLDQLVSEARMTADVVLESSSRIAEGNMQLQSGTTETSARLQETAACMQEIRDGAQTSAAQSATARQIASQAMDSAQNCGALVKEVVRAMDAIHDSSRKIGDIVGLIDSIAFQTNILALNAAVEAARAGEHGKGFAVVASEVRSLAQRSATAAKDVRALIQSSLQHASQGTVLVNSAGDSMENVVTQTQRIEQVIATLSQLTADQAQGLDKTSETVRNLDLTARANAQLVDQSSISAAQLLEQASALQSVVAGVHSGKPLPMQASDLTPISTPMKMAVTQPSRPVPTSALEASY